MKDLEYATSQADIDDSVPGPHLLKAGWHLHF